MQTAGGRTFQARKNVQKKDSECESEFWKEQDKNIKTSIMSFRTLSRLGVSSMSRLTLKEAIIDGCLSLCYPRSGSAQSYKKTPIRPFLRG